MEKFTREQLNSMDKDALVTLLLTYMEASQKTIDAQTEYSAGSEPLYPLERATLSAW